MVNLFRSSAGGYYGDVANAAARLALADQPGQYGTQANDPGYVYIQIATPATTPANWYRLRHFGAGNLAATLAMPL
jgi:hypothetical protein